MRFGLALIPLNFRFPSSPAESDTSSSVALVAPSTRYALLNAEPPASRPSRVRPSDKWPPVMVDRRPLLALPPIDKVPRLLAEVESLRAESPLPLHKRVSRPWKEPPVESCSAREMDRDGLVCKHSRVTRLSGSPLCRGGIKKGRRRPASSLAPRRATRQRRR